MPLMDQMVPQEGQPLPEQAQAQAQIPEGENPVIKALKDIQVFVAGQAEQGAPNAIELQSWLQQGLQLMMSAGQQEQAPPQAEAQAPQAVEQGNNATQNAVPIL